MRKLSFATGALCLSLMAGSAQGAVLFSFIETGGDVVGTLTGSLDLTGATRYNRTFAFKPPKISPDAASVGFGGYAPTPVSLYGYAATPSSDFGIGATTLASGYTGFAFAVLAGATYPGVFVPRGYDSGDPLTGSLTFSGATFSSLGVNPGSYVYTLTGSNDTATISFIPAAVVPLPATLPLLLGALGLAFAATRRRA